MNEKNFLSNLLTENTLSTLLEDTTKERFLEEEKRFEILQQIEGEEEEEEEEIRLRTEKRKQRVLLHQQNFNLPKTDQKGTHFKDKLRKEENSFTENNNNTNNNNNSNNKKNEKKENEKESKKLSNEGFLQLLGKITEYKLPENYQTKEKEERTTKKSKEQLEMDKMCVFEINLALELTEELLIKEEKIEKGLQNMATLYKNKKKNQKMASDYIMQASVSSNQIKLFKKQLLRNLVWIKFGSEAIDSKYAIAIDSVNETKDSYISFNENDLINVFERKKGRLKKNDWIGQINGKTGKFNPRHVHLIKSKIIDEIFDKQNKKIKSPVPKIPKKINWKYLNILEIDCEEVARQITIREFEVYEKLNFTEFLQQSWNKKKLFTRAPNIRYMISRFNELSFWCCTMILGAEKLVQRAMAVEYFIQFALHLRKFNNFNCLMAVVSALKSNPLQRLKHTFGDISLESEEHLKDLDELLNSENAFKNYRRALLEAYMEGKSAIPFIGIHLTDLTFLDDTSDTFEKNGDYSRKKMETMSKAIMSILKYQTRNYNFVPILELQKYFKDYPALESEALYELSLKREPRGVEYKNLI
ncbi:guanine nucleotide exchange factor [Anaeramoeba flamelloides]|uniref:Guanine nucleotide exchange factor n=1 Tax=Anaeramoeba flamelloides TaxID=1746091 RepID=A0ABQ8XPJ3_9EUKA|nr:guanine nucleotide exchange factor [Anaeramoeba flamelloides]